jgi:hypothetical protein
LELAQAPPGGLGARDRQLPRDPKHDRSCQLTIILPYRLGLDQGASIPHILCRYLADQRSGQPWFDEGTRNKVFVLGKDPGSTLRNLIDAKDLPKPYGGELDWKYEDEPLLDDVAREVISETPKGPAVFIDGKAVQPPPRNITSAVAGAKV